jgi:hypothetical protein
MSDRNDDEPDALENYDEDEQNEDLQSEKGSDESTPHLNQHWK